MRKNLAILSVTLAVGLSAGPAAAADPIRIGTMFETSGSIASLGTQGLEGATIAVQQINAAGGIGGRLLEMVQVNTESDETKAVTAVKRLIERENVVAIIGPHGSGECLAMLSVVQRGGIPLICNGASMKIAGPAKDRKWVFSATSTDAALIGVEIEHMKSKGISKVALLNADSGFGVSGREQWERLLQAHRLTLTIQETFGNTDQTVMPQLTKIKASDAQATVIWASGPAQAIAVKNYRLLGIDRPVYLPNGATDPNLSRLAGDAVNGVLFSNSKLTIWEQLPDSDGQKALFRSFVKDFHDKYGRNPTGFAGNGYDSVRVIAAAIKNSKADPRSIRDAIEGLRDFIGVTGIYTYSPDDHYGIQASTLVMQTIGSGKFLPAK